MRRPPTHLRNTLLAKNSRPSKFLSMFLSCVYYSVYSDAWNCATMYVVPNPLLITDYNSHSQSESCHCQHPFSLCFTISCVSKVSKAKHPFLLCFTLFHCVFTVYHCVVCQQSQQSTPFPSSLAGEACWLWAKEDGTNCADALDIDKKICMGGRNTSSWLYLLGSKIMEWHHGRLDTWLKHAKYFL